MKLPDNLLIDGVRYAVETTAEPIIISGVECGGSCDYNNCRITLSETKINGGRVQVTLLHEVVHAILHERGFCDESENEELVEGIAKGILDLISHNDGLEAYIKNEHNRERERL